MKRNITEAPDRWMVIDIDGVRKVFASWAGGYLGSDRWKLNSGITSVKEDKNYYYFHGESGSCYKCHKKGYGVITSYAKGVLNDMTKLLEKEGVPFKILENYEKES